jgi:hypothetical protein
MPDALQRLIRAIRQPTLVGGLSVLVSQAIVGCSCPDDYWEDVQVPVAGDSLTEAKIRGFLETLAVSETPLAQLERLYRLRPALPQPPELPEGYMGPQQYALLRAMGASGDVRDICQQLCAVDPSHRMGAAVCNANVNDAGEPVVDCSIEGVVDCVGGRRPAGLVSDGAYAAAPSRLARFWAALAHEEAAAVHAFVSLTARLQALGAPADLVAASRAAVDDELLHVALAAERARAHGAHPPAVVVGPTVAADRLELALQNASAGCVRESLAALEMTWAAGQASDPVDRTVFARIAADEARHANLSWALHHWLRGGLSAADQARLDAALLEAQRVVRGELVQRDTTGLPQPSTIEALALFDGMVA